ncbi:MAG: hypothetical protein PCFJNLEI_02718 [Verrucomicrobiae bacterium]|nr:hypothetical protein [Verrucomicrobiae bacterium]
MKWPDPANPQPDDFRWDGGVRAGLTWDGTLYRDLARFPAGGSLFWSVYLKPGSAPGNQNGFWFNFGGGWCHLAHDNLSQMLTGAAPRLYWEPPHRSPGSPPLPPGERSDAERTGQGHWKLVIEATQFVTGTVVPVWVGVKAGGNDPVGDYTRVAGCDPLPVLSLAAS